MLYYVEITKRRITTFVLHLLNMYYKLQLILYCRSKTKHCKRLLEDDLATECYSNSNVDQLNGRRKGNVFYVLHSY